MHAESSRLAQRRAALPATLASLSRQSLAFCPEFPAIAARWQAWWHCQGDRPLLIAQVPTTDRLRWDKGFDLFKDPPAWVRMRSAQVAHTRYLGESLPFVRVDLGPVALAAFLGAELHFAAAEQTTWQTPTIASWSPPPALRLAPDNFWWQQVQTLTRHLIEDARGRYLICLPDLTGAIDALANLRHPEQLCLDLFEHQEAILAAAADGVDAWEEAFTTLHELILGQGVAITQWVSCWSPIPFTVPTCDFNALIGPAAFQRFCLPSLREQARRAGRCIFHLDGPAAARHADALGATPEITAIQFTPGAGTPSAVAQLPMFKRLQAMGKPLFIECPAAEVARVAGELVPGGLALRVSDLSGLAEGQALLAWRARTYG